MLSADSPQSEIQSYFQIRGIGSCISAGAVHGAAEFAGVIGQCAALAHLDLSHTDIREAGAASLAPVLGQCAALTHLNLNGNYIQAPGVGRLAGVLGQF